MLTTHTSELPSLAPSAKDRRESPFFPNSDVYTQLWKLPLRSPSQPAATLSTSSSINTGKDWTPLSSSVTAIPRISDPCEVRGKASKEP